MITLELVEEERPLRIPELLNDPGLERAGLFQIVHRLLELARQERRLRQGHEISEEVAVERGPVALHGPVVRGLTTVDVDLHAVIMPALEEEAVLGIVVRFEPAFVLFLHVREHGYDP